MIGRASRNLEIAVHIVITEPLAGDYGDVAHGASAQLNGGATQTSGVRARIN